MAKHRKLSLSRRRQLIAGTTGALALIGYGGVAQAQQPQHDWSGVAQCESSGDWHINTGNGYYGGLQFSQSTWDAYKPAGAPARADQASQAQQIEAAEATLAVQGPGAWPTCGKYLSSGTTASAAPAPAPARNCDRVWPVDGPITSGYGDRAGGFHNGTDWGVPMGTPISAVTSGTITIAGFNNDPGGYGNYIAQNADSGESIEYGHVSEIYVSPGQYVTAGETIGAVGSAGSSTGPHLHLRVSSGDPIAFLSGACDTPVVSDTPIYHEVEHDIANAPTPIFDDLVVEHGSWHQLWQDNIDIVGDNPDLIYPGQNLRLADGSNYVVASGDTLSGIASR